MINSFRQRARNLRKWVRHNITRRWDRALELSQEPDMPYLSYPPIASSLDNTLAAIFTKLSPETRWMVLIAAFGGRTVHMHTRLNVPALPHKKQLLVTAAVPDK